MVVAGDLVLGLSNNWVARRQTHYQFFKVLDDDVLHIDFFLHMLALSLGDLALEAIHGLDVHLSNRLLKALNEVILPRALHGLFRCAHTQSAGFYQGVDTFLKQLTALQCSFFYVAFREKFGALVVGHKVQINVYYDLVAFALIEPLVCSELEALQLRNFQLCLRVLVLHNARNLHREAVLIVFQFTTKQSDLVPIWLEERFFQLSHFFKVRLFFYTSLLARWLRRRVYRLESWLRRRVCRLDTWLRRRVCRFERRLRRQVYRLERRLRLRIYSWAVLSGGCSISRFCCTKALIASHNGYLLA